VDLCGLRADGGQKLSYNERSSRQAGKGNVLPQEQARPDSYPDFHFLLIASNLGAEWLFDAARVYWDRYRPTIISDTGFLPLIPLDRTLIVTVIARRDTAARFGVELAQINPNAYFDGVIYDLFDDAKDALNERARLGEPFGVPLVLPTATRDPNAPFIPTPRLQATRPPAGFVTQVPPTPLPTSENEPTPITPTPGSVVGG
jgi:hypothetical protein